MDPWIPGSTPVSVKQAHYLDGLRFCFEAASLAGPRLEESLLKTARALVLKERNYRVPTINALTDAWLVVDAVFRARRLISGLPGLKHKRSPGRTVFLKRTAEVEPLRNTIQHLDTDMKDLTDVEERAWGTLEWFASLPETGHKVHSLLLVPGFKGGGTYRLCTIARAPLTQRIDQIILRCRKAQLNISDAVLAMNELDQGLRKSLGTPYAGPPIDERDMLFHAVARIDPVNDR